MKILFVCTGNVCRSAVAEGLMNKYIADNKINGVSADSCGTAASVLYRVPKIVLRLMEQEGIDLKGHISTQVNETLVDAADIILVMEEFHKEYVGLCFPQSRGKLHLLKEFVNAGGGKEIADPMGHSEEIYVQVTDELKKYVAALGEIVVPACV